MPRIAHGKLKSVAVPSTRCTQKPRVAGYVDALDDWVTLRLPAMAEENILIPIGQGRFHARSAGEILHPEREPLAVLESLKLALGSTTFSAQYQHARCRPMARS